MKQKSFKQKKKKSRTERILLGGIFFTCLFLFASLLFLIRPSAIKEAGLFLKGICASAGSASVWIAERFSDAFSQSPSDPSREETGPSLDSHTEDPSVSEDPVPYLVYSDIQGNIADLDQSFPESNDSVYSVMLDTAAGPMLYYNQGDSRWGDFLYGGSDPLKKYGCGPTAIAMVINSFSPTSVTPVEIAQWAADNGYWAPGSGSYHSLIPDGLSAFGLSVESVSQLTEEAVCQELEAGHLLIALMGKGALTQNGHFIIIINECGSQNVYIADPNSYPNSCAQWNLSQIVDELKNSRDSGGPLWAVWPP